MPDVPSWWEFILLALAAWRTFRLLAEDTILETPRRKLLRLGKTWKPGDRIPKEYREELMLFITCPYCAGFWISVAWWGVWMLWPHATTMVAAPWAISAIVAYLAKGDERLNQE